MCATELRGSRCLVTRFVWSMKTAKSPELTAALQQHVRGQLAPYKYPRWIEFVDELPKTATGKIQRFKLRAKATE